MSPKVLVLVSHPNIEDSRINDALMKALAEHPAVTVRHIDSIRLNESQSFDATIEQAIIDEHDAVVLQFPWYWYAVPASMKKYLDEILTPGWAYRGGKALAGKPLMTAISTGGPAQAYGPEGNNRFTMTEFLAPLVATANMTQMIWHEPFVIHGVRTLTEAELSEAIEEYLERIDELLLAPAGI